MKRLLTIILLLALGVQALGASVLLSAAHRRNADPGGGGYLLSEDFESSLGAGWTTNGSVNDQYATSPAPLVGSFSLALLENVGWAGYTFASDVTAERWFFIRLVTPNGANASVFTLFNSTPSSQLVFQFRNDRIRINHGGVIKDSLGSATSSESVMWIRYVPATNPGVSGDGIVELYMNKNSSSETRPTLTESMTNGQGGPFITVRLDSIGDDPHIFDKFRISATEIGSDPL